MGKFTQANRPLAVHVEGLDPDALLLVGFRGEEAVSSLFRFQLDLQVENPAQIAFDKLLGKSVTVELELPGGKQPREKKRFFNGICRRVAQGDRDSRFTQFRMELVPSAWLLTKVIRSRVFQGMDVAQILGLLLGVQNLELGIRTDFRLDRRELARRDYCVQYRESDFNFASRLMAEEGIFYYFQHKDDAHVMVLGNRPRDLDSVEPPNGIVYRTGRGQVVKIADAYDGGTIKSWEKVQELRAGRVTLRDHTFEKPEADLEASRQIQPEVQVGGVKHKLNGFNSLLEWYDFPGQYAKRFDGINRGGGEQPEEITKIYKEKDRTARLRMEQEATPVVAIHGDGDCRHFVAGHSFTLWTGMGTDEEQAQAGGEYVLTGVQHAFGLPGAYASGDSKGFYYRNSFTCTPAALPYRPPRLAPKPVIAGTQTAVVVGPPGQEIYTDKYGRVKIKFFWDRGPKRDPQVLATEQAPADWDRSCWVRVAQFWAGKRWGAHFWPRIGQEVVVAFEEGDPDQPIIVGSVYNAENMPPYELPKHQTRSGVKTRSTLQGTPENFNEIRFEDKKGAEEVHVQAERNLTVQVKASESRCVGGDCTLNVGGDRVTKIKGDELIEVNGKNGWQIGVDPGGYLLWAKAGFALGTEEAHASLQAQQNMFLATKTGFIQLNAVGGAVRLYAKQEIALQCGGGSIVIDAGGNVFINGASVSINSAAAPAIPPAADPILPGQDPRAGAAISAAAADVVTVPAAPSPATPGIPLGPRGADWDASVAAAGKAIGASAGAKSP